MKSDPTSGTSLRLEQVRQKLAGQNGPAYWRSLDELAQTEEFAELLHREFPQMLPTEGSGLDRRRFLQLMGASLALAGLSACSIQPEEHILPYTKQPEEIIPGKPLYFASAHPMGGYGRGLLVESHMGRPSKVEGNPDHPSSLGATDLFDQASVLGLYDPDRSQVPMLLGQLRSWERFVADLGPDLEAQLALQGEGLALVVEPNSSPTRRRQLADFRSRFPKARVVHWSAANDQNAREGARLAFGADVEVHYDLSHADVILTLDCDLLTEGPGAVRYAKDFARHRRLADGAHAMNRLYAVESSPTNTGVIADHRLSLSPSEVEAFAAALAAQLGVEGVRGAAPGDTAATVRTIARDLQSASGKSIVAAGPSAPAELHALALAMNARLGNLDHTVKVQPDLLDAGRPTEDLRSLVADMSAGRIDLVFLIGGNPGYDAPADLDFAGAVAKVRRRVRVGLYQDESSALCQWHLPMSHYLESWSDVRSHDGTATVVQPLIAPLYGTKSEHEVLAFLNGDEAARGYDLVRDTWRSAGGASFEKSWRRWVHDGMVRDSRPAPTPVALRGPAVAAAAGRLGRASGDLHVTFRPDPTVRDGAFANNGWLQECPKPHSRITWDNAALVSPRTAERLGVENEEAVLVHVGDRSLEMAVWVLPGHADDTLTLHLGYGRVRAGAVGNGCGFDTYTLRTSAALWTAPARVEPLGRRHRLASTQTHSNMEGRELVRHGTYAQVQAAHSGHGGHGEHGGHGLDFVHGHLHVDPDLSIMPGFEYEGYKWGMSIDLSACTGCNACVVACHAENNISIVGKQEVLNGRELHWLRIDRYFEGDLDAPTTYLQPVMCQHCEQAPCEVVCPVAATVHTDEGLNTMAYNRCVGTRYCANNCPYKVRRFNFYQYADEKTESLKLGRNPDVTVRSRGVMEKCSYCVQRINHAKIEATVKELPLSEIGLQSACQQACPTEAIQFGDLNDPEARVSKWKESELNYGILTELGTRPRTTYLARVSNPNPELERS